MDNIQDHLQQFHEFALARIGIGGADLSIDELFEEWRTTHPLTEEHRANCKAVAASLRDFDSGERGVPAEQFLRDFRTRNEVK